MYGSGRAQIINTTARVSFIRVNFVHDKVANTHLFSWFNCCDTSLFEMASKPYKLFVRKKVSKRGLHLITSGKYTKRKQHELREASCSTDELNIFESSESLETSKPSEIPPHKSSSSNISFSKPLHTEDNEDKNELTPNSLIAKHFSAEDSAAPLVAEKCRPIGHWDISSLTGLRVCNIAHVITESRKLENHECRSKPPGHLAYYKEEKNGINSNIYFKCTACTEIRKICTNPRKIKTINFSAV